LPDTAGTRSDCCAGDADGRSNRAAEQRHERALLQSIERRGGSCKRQFVTAITWRDRRNG
jgi:hypothetical protein